MNIWQRLVYFLKNLQLKSFFKNTFNWKIGLTIVAVIFLSISTLFISFWLNLPEHKLASTIEQQINDNLPPNIRINIFEVDLNLVGITLLDSVLSFKGNTAIDIVIDSLQVKLASWKLLLLRIPIVLKSNDIVLDMNYSLYSSNLYFDAKDVILNNIPQVRKLKLLSSAATMKIDGDLNIAENALSTNFAVDNIKVNPENSFLGILPDEIKSNVSFSKISGKFNFKQANAKLEVVTKGIYTGRTLIDSTWRGDVLSSEYKVTTKGQLDEAVTNSDDPLLQGVLRENINGSDVDLSISFKGLFNNLAMQRNN